MRLTCHERDRARILAHFPRFVLIGLGAVTSAVRTFGAPPQTVAAPPRHTAIVQARQTPVTRVPAGTWAVSLPGDVRVRLVGVTSGPSAVGPWWDPSGGPLARSPYPEETAAERTLRPSDYALFGGKPGERPFYFAYEITQQINADVQVIGANTLDPNTEGSLIRTRVRCLAFLPPSKRAASATLSLASAPWQTIARADAAGGHFTGKDKQSVGYDFHLTAHALPIRVDSTPSGNVIRVEWSGHFGAGNPWQVEVLDQKGQPMQQVVGGSTSATNGYHIEFRPPGIENPTLDMVKEIRVEVRPAQDIEFDGVALQRTARTAKKAVK